MQKWWFQAYPLLICRWKSKLSDVAMPITAATLNLRSLLEKLSINPSNCYVAIELVNAFSYIPMNMGIYTVCIYMARITVYLYCLVPGLCHSPANCKVQRDVDSLDNTENTILTHSIEATMLTGHYDQEIASTLGALNICVPESWRWTPWKFKLPATSGKFPGVQKSGECCTSLPKWETGTSLAVQCLRLLVSHAGGVCSIPGQGTRIPHATWRDQNK